MVAKYDLTKLAEGIAAGDRRSIARSLRLIEDDQVRGRNLAAGLRDNLRGSRVIGVTGNPGAGKSTVADQMIGAWRGQGKTVVAHEASHYSSQVGLPNCCSARRGCEARPNHRPYVKTPARPASRERAFTPDT